jgi:carbon-monoxide dehydrogenase small subunit
VKLDLVVNGTKRATEAPGAERLLDTLRERLGLTGTKEGCGEGECGACTVLLDGEPVMSCLVPASQAQGKSVLTIEGLAEGGALHALQREFARLGGSQCGICTPGMILAAHAWSERPETAEDVREALAGNLCRCTGYMRIFEAVAAARGGSE